MMTRRSDSFVLMLLMAVALMVGCGKGSLLPQLGEDGSGLPQALVQADSLMNSRPDSALAVLEGAEGQMAGESKAVRMCYQLLRHQAMNKAFVPFTSDSLMLDVADYYDRHGTANDRMLAHYLLGCVYRDMKEAPHAIDCYLDAIAKADTTRNDCDFRTLSSVYSQMAWIYHKQLLLSYEIECRKQAMHYALLSNNVLISIYEIELTASTYILLNKNDSAELFLRNALYLYDKNGYTQEALFASLTLMRMYLNNPAKLTEVKDILDRFEANSNVFDKDHEMPPSKRQFYYYKGKYYESINNLDSAEYYYRKVYRSNMSYTSQDPMYKGLLSVYQKRHIADSIAKYAQLYCMANDSSIALKDQQLTAQLAASYDYNYYQHQAFEKAKEAQTFRLISLFGLLVLTLLVAYVIYVKKRKAADARQLRANLIAAITEKETISEELNQLKSKDLEKLIVQKEQTEKELLETISELEKKTMKPKVSDNLQGFMDCQIATLFVKKSENRAERLIPNQAEWKLLVSQFSKYMPNSYEAFLKGKLSSLELYVCILVISGFSESSIIKMVDGKPQTVTNAKARANKKLFNVSSAASLKAHLKHLALFDVI